MKFWWWRRHKVEKPTRRLRINRESAPDLTDEEAAEYEVVLNAAMAGSSKGVVFERGEDGVLRQKKG